MTDVITSAPLTEQDTVVGFLSRRILPYPHKGGEQEGCRVGANSTLLCDTSPGRGWVKRSSLGQDEQSPTQR